MFSTLEHCRSRAQWPIWHLANSAELAIQWYSRAKTRMLLSLYTSPALRGIETQANDRPDAACGRLQLQVHCLARLHREVRVMRHRRLLNNGAIAGLLTALCAIAIAAGGREVLTSSAKWARILRIQGI